MNEILLNINCENFTNEFNKNFKVNEINFCREKTEYLKNLIEIYYVIKNNNLFGIINLNSNIIDWIENNIFLIKYNLNKFNLWSSLSDEIKIFYNDLLNLYIIFNNIIHINDFQKEKLIKINGKYFYDSIQIKENKPFIIFECDTNEIFFISLKNNEFIQNSPLNKFYIPIFNLIYMNIEVETEKYLELEISKYFKKLYDFHYRLRELK